MMNEEQAAEVLAGIIRFFFLLSVFSLQIAGLWFLLDISWWFLTLVIPQIIMQLCVGAVPEEE
jgi:hypothetical protein